MTRARAPHRQLLCGGAVPSEADKSLSTLAGSRTRGTLRRGIRPAWLAGVPLTALVVTTVRVSRARAAKFLPSMSAAGRRRSCARATASTGATRWPAHIHALTEHRVDALGIPRRASATLIGLTTRGAATDRTTASAKSTDAPSATNTTIGVDVACDRPGTILQDRTSKIARRIDGRTLRRCVARQQCWRAEDG